GIESLEERNLPSGPFPAASLRGRPRLPRFGGEIAHPSVFMQTAYIGNREGADGPAPAAAGVRAYRRESARPVRAIGLGAVPVQGKRMLGDLESAFMRNALLAPFDFLVDEFFDPPAIEAD